MRYYIICQGLFDGSRPWVLAETVDEAYARDEANTWKTTVVLSREVALSDPRLRDAVLAWEAKDDREYERDMLREDADAAAGRHGEPVVPSPDGWAEDPERALAEATSGVVLTFSEFRALPAQAGLSEVRARDRYLVYLQLEADWAQPGGGAADH